MTTTRNNLLRTLPAVSKLLAEPAIQVALVTLPLATVTEAARVTLERTRSAMSCTADTPSLDALAEAVIAEARLRAAPTLVRAVNATGVVLHTGLGRSRLAEEACRAIAAVAGGHSTLEIDFATGRRGSRTTHVEGLLCELTGAAAATVVNNCAGAVFLVVSALAAGREVVISRGELVEIGGAFRMPDIVRASGATLVEVGTTNRTRISDYAEAITERTGLLLRCHPSNFAIVGFTEEASTEELVALGRARGIPTLDDQGSGALVVPPGVPVTSTLRDSVSTGCDIVTASGDKLLGGPQAGLILGYSEFVNRTARHPLARALRADKLTLAGLEATLKLYRDPRTVMERIPTLRYLARTAAEIRSLAERLLSLIVITTTPGRLSVDLQESDSQVGGGSLPGERLPTVCVALRPVSAAVTLEAFTAALRRHTPPVYARVHHGAILLDPRTVDPDELPVIACAVAGAAARI